MKPWENTLTWQWSEMRLAWANMWLTFFWLSRKKTLRWRKHMIDSCGGDKR